VGIDDAEALYRARESRLREWVLRLSVRDAS
jgi:hypothetical protein